MPPSAPTAIGVHVLVDDAHEPRERSEALPDLDLALVAELSAVRPVSKAIRRLRASAED